ncbi:MAG: DUF86 domain-containing protein [Bdellovibrionota bacterium]
MSRHTDETAFADILEAARLTLSFVAGKSKEEFLGDVQCQDAVIRRITIVGEASRRLSEEARAAHPDIPWRQIIGMRNLVVHVYDSVDLLIVWETATIFLPELIGKLEKRS